jgi:hypothetical protein
MPVILINEALMDEMTDAQKAEWCLSDPSGMLYSYDSPDKSRHSKYIQILLANSAQLDLSSKNAPGSCYSSYSVPTFY